MKLFHHRIKVNSEERESARIIALKSKLPSIIKNIAIGEHSWQKTYKFTRILGYKRIYDSIDTYKEGMKEVELLRKRCKDLGIIPLFIGDYISLEYFPRRNIIHEEITDSEFSNGIKTITRNVYFDVDDYILDDKNDR